MTYVAERCRQEMSPNKRCRQDRDVIETCDRDVAEPYVMVRGLG